MLKVKSFSDAAYEEIKNRIIKGIYKPGESLNERNLSNDFGISRTPVREALQKLSMEGWVLNAPYKKNEVRKFSLEDIVEAQKVRSALEVLAIKEIVDKITHADLKHLEKLVEKQKKTPDHDKFIQIDREFHDYIYEKSNNSLLISLMENINDIVRYFGILALDLPGRNEVAIIEHENILEALRKKDINLVVEKMEAHMENTTAAIVKRSQIME